MEHSRPQSETYRAKSAARQLRLIREVERARRARVAAYSAWGAREAALELQQHMAHVAAHAVGAPAPAAAVRAEQRGVVVDRHGAGAQRRGHTLLCGLAQVQPTKE